MNPNTDSLLTSVQAYQHLKQSLEYEMEVECFIYGAKKMEVYPNVSPIKLIHL